jgi:hypothetical protein
MAFEEIYKEEKSWVAVGWVKRGKAVEPAEDFNRVILATGF